MADNSEKMMDARVNTLIELVRANMEFLKTEDWRKEYSAELKRQFDDHADPVYEERARVLALACRLAEQVPGWKVGLGRHNPEDKSWDPEWTFIVFMEWTDPKKEEYPPAFQASWHIHQRQVHLFTWMPTYEGKWDGHTTQQKYENIKRLCR